MLFSDILKEVGVAAGQITAMGQRPLGEARNIFDGGGEYVSILGGNNLFHHPSDRWPDSVDLDSTTLWITALVALGRKFSFEH